MGVDLRSGSPRAKRGARYSVCIIKPGEKVEFESATLYDVVKLAREFKPEILATDNIYELVRDAKEIYYLMSRLPKDTRLVQVTFSGSRFMSLEELAREEEIDLNPLDPLDEARAIAVLALKGYGKEILSLKPECRIVITRNRSIKQGGSGRERWMRSIEAGILEETRRIENLLQEKGIDYDLYAVRSAGGLRRAEFVVYEDYRSVKMKLSGELKENDWTPVKIVIKPIWENRLKFVNKDANRFEKGLIVGLDPGLNFGLAILDLEGKILALKTLRRASRSEIIENILEHGYPLIIATDVDPPPKNVVKIAKSLGVRVEVAKRDMRSSEKLELVSKFLENSGVRVKSAHERDSLAAAIKVYKKFKPLLSKALSRSAELGFNVDKETLFREMLKGKSIDDAIKSAVSKRTVEEPRIREVDKSKERRSDKTQEGLLRRIEELELLLEHYKEELRKKDREILDLRERLSLLEDKRALELEKDRRIAMRDERIRELTEILEKQRREIEKLRKRIEDMERRDESKDLEGWVPLKVLSTLSVDEMQKLALEGRIERGDVILVKNISGAGLRAARMLKEIGVSGVIYRSGNPSHEFLEELGGDVRIVDGRDLEIRWRGLVPYIKEECMFDIASLDEGNQLDGFESILMEIENYRSRLTKAMRRRSSGG